MWHRREVGEALPQKTKASGPFFKSTHIFSGLQLVVPGERYILTRTGDHYRFND